MPTGAYITHKRAPKYSPKRPTDTFAACLSEEAFHQLMLRQLHLYAANEAIELMNYTSVAKGEGGLPPIELQTAIKMLAMGGADEGKTVGKQIHARPPPQAAAPKRSDAVVSQLREELRKCQFDNTQLRQEVVELEAGGAVRSARGSGRGGRGSGVGAGEDGERDQKMEKMRGLQKAAEDAAAAAAAASEAAARAAKAAEAASRMYGGAVALPSGGFPG